MTTSTFVLYLDESGDHSLVSVDPLYPVFTLAGCIFENNYHDSVATDQMRAYKLAVFGSDTIILRTADIQRRRRGFDWLRDETFRDIFHRATNAFVEALDFTVVAAVIKKRELIKKYRGDANDPYTYALECILERFYYFLRERNENGTIIAESRGATENEELSAAFYRFMTQGTSFLRARDLQAHIAIDLRFRPKTDNLVGLQIADLVANPLSNIVMGKPNWPDMDLVRTKLRRGPGGEFLGYGLKILP